MTCQINQNKYMYDTDWLNVCLPLAEDVINEQYKPTQEELEEFNTETELNTQYV